MTFVGIGFAVLAGIMIMIYCLGYYSTLNKLNYTPAKVRTKTIQLVIFFGLYIVYMWWVSNTGILTNDEFPPKVPLLIFFPVFQLSIIIILRKKNRDLILALPTSGLIYVQAFRIPVELLILGMFLEDIFPQQATFEGYNYEIVTGIIAIVVGYFVQKGSIGRKGILAWNVIGLLSLATIIFIVTTSFYFPGLWGETEPMVSMRFTKLPYLLLAGILAPMAAAFHLLSLRQQKYIRLGKSA